jgi:hypothetical protein
MRAISRRWAILSCKWVTLCKTPSTSYAFWWPIRRITPGWAPSIVWWCYCPAMWTGTSANVPARSTTSYWAPAHTSSKCSHRAPAEASANVPSWTSHRASPRRPMWAPWNPSWAPANTSQWRYHRGSGNASSFLQWWAWADTFSYMSSLQAPAWTSLLHGPSWAPANASSVSFNRTPYVGASACTSGWALAEAPSRAPADALLSGWTPALTSSGSTDRTSTAIVVNRAPANWPLRAGNWPFHWASSWTDTHTLAHWVISTHALAPAYQCQMKHRFQKQ